ncbi:MAG: extracellular solute-binding protein [Oscillospiraceae bacterium]|nr:extracellular solute-binding protein [Oscillospiraceae bacterium]
MIGFTRRTILITAATAAMFVALSCARAAAETVFTCFINHTWYPVSSFTGVIPEEITRLTGVRLDVTIAKDQRQLNMMLASNALPDLIFTGSQFDALSDPAVCLDYDTLIERAGLDWAIAEDLRSNALIFSGDGKLYTIINYYTRTQDWADTRSVPMTASLMARQDILDDMGNPPLNTTDDLMDVYLRVRREYPDIIPLMFESTHRFNAFRTYFGLGLTEFTRQPDGRYLFFARDPRYKEMLAWLNRLYREGCIPPENFAASPRQENVPYKQGRVFSYSACTQNVNLSLDNALKQIDPSYHSVELPPLQGANYAMSSLGWSGTFIPLNNHDPEVAITFIQWMFTPQAQRLTQWGREGIDYTLNDEQLPVYSAALMASLQDDSYIQTYNPWFHFGSSAVLESEGRCALLPFNDYADAYDQIRQAYINKPWIIAAAPKTGDPEKRAYDRILAAVNDQETYILVSESVEAFEARWEAYQDSLLQMDVEGLELHINEAIPELRARYAAP